MATTRSRPRGRETARPNSDGAAAGHMTKIWGVSIGGAAAILAFLALTGTGHDIDRAVQRFMLFYAGVFALIGLCASVGAGLVATDRIVLSPGHRVWAQSAHRAISFSALAFLLVHILTEILALRVHVIDAVVPFLSPFRTFYIGLGTIASDLVILLAATGILRSRFTSSGISARRWRAIHYTSYAAFVFGIWHGLLAGRPGRPYVDWSYGLVVALVALGLAVRFLANPRSPRERRSVPAAGEATGEATGEPDGSGAAQVRAVAMLAQLGPARAKGPASTPTRAFPALPGYGPQASVPSSTISGPLPRADSGGFRRPAPGYEDTARYED